MADKTTANQELEFEEALARLEGVVGELEGDVKLERALQLFEQGIKLSRTCEGFLTAAEQKIELIKRGENGVTVEPFEPSENAAGGQ